MTGHQSLDGTFLLTGAEGMLGAAVTAALHVLPGRRTVYAFGRAQLDVRNRDAVREAAVLRPDVIVHCAGFTDMDRCELERERCFDTFVNGTRHIVALAGATGARVVYPQSVFVFGDTAHHPLSEDAPLAPESAYGEAKAVAEELVLGLGAQALVIRMAGFFGGEHRDKNFVGKFSRYLAGELARHRMLTVSVGDRVWQPTYTADLARNTLALVERECSGVYHMAAHGTATFLDVATEMVECWRLGDRVELKARLAAEFSNGEPARRPARALLDNRRLRSDGLDLQRNWRPALREYLAAPYFESVLSGVAV